MRRPPRPLSTVRAARLRPLLDALDAQVDRTARISADPVEFPRGFADPHDAEVAGLVAVSLAYGRADVFKAVVARVLARMAPSPARFADDFARAPDCAAFDGILYRFNRPADLAALVAAIGHVRRQHGSLGARFAALFADAGGTPAALRPALARFAAELREAPPVGPLLLGRGGRGLRHLLPDPAGAGASKRWNLYLRWMIRGPDAVDLGIWSGVPPAALVIPLDTHVHRVARHLGLTARRDASWRTAEEITAALRSVDPDDPVRYDFALCHLGMSGLCPARQDPARCAACRLVAACLGAAPRAAARAPARRLPRSPATRSSTRSRASTRLRGSRARGGRRSRSATGRRSSPGPPRDGP